MVEKSLCNKRMNYITAEHQRSKTIITTLYDLEKNKEYIKSNIDLLQLWSLFVRYIRLEGPKMFGPREWSFDSR
jgi:hypothetical protein